MAYSAVDRTISLGLTPNGAGVSIGVIPVFAHDLTIDMIISQPSNRLSYIR